MIRHFHISSFLLHDFANRLHVYPFRTTRISKGNKKVAHRIKPVATTLPEDFRIVRRIPSSPLESLPILPFHPPEFTPGSRYTLERKSYKTWSLRNIPIPPGIFDRVVEIIKSKIAAGVYEPSNSSYRSRWFCVLKKDGKSLRLVHDLQPLNAVVIKDAGLPPMVEQYAESFGGRGCYGIFDHFPIPSRHSSADVFLLQDEIPDIAVPFVDDVPVKGPPTRYELGPDTFETIPQNPGIRRFVWEHLLCSEISYMCPFCCCCRPSLHIRRPST